MQRTGADVLLSSEPLCPRQALQVLGPPGDADGATVVFGGAVRADRVEGRRVVGITYEAYPEMALDTMARIAREARRRFDLHRVWIAHRTGYVAVGEFAFLVAVRARHREEAFSALGWICDAVKTRVPLWKKEHLEDGQTRWKEGAVHDRRHA